MSSYSLPDTVVQLIADTEIATRGEARLLATEVLELRGKALTAVTALQSIDDGTYDPGAVKACEALDKLEAEHPHRTLPLMKWRGQ